ncbi:type I-C CRISPR-associated protein Cas8c/Csd1 [Sulfuricella sp.]|uniref:type I-C CRISPR-associated protein Cas8c/Csd1 n=1 Tax=Sulfuricella sp. TaxID=2099377 RepID=UPI002BB2735D|nr:type I-C CRISPR-associated protein Cas8c/Csd1 [Sulfuricella sp.]HUX62749.1 type I-C CRISPR-associated protein Cas8c/Csd1 [Sulfuricella sp.]
MILQALNAYYERSGELPREGWIRRGVDYIVVLNTEGNCTNIEPVGEMKKGKTVSREMLVPAIGKQAMKHTNSGTDANLLWDNASFALGSGKKGAQKLTSFLDTMRVWLKECHQDTGIKAVQRFCKSLQTNPDSLADLLKRFRLDEEFSKRDPVLVFRLVGDVEEVHARATVRATYEKQFALDDPNPLIGNCLITGKHGVPIAPNETVIKNVWNAQPAGANIISFNARAFESYGKRNRNGENAPISKGASFAYTTALNHLLTSRQRIQVGDSSTVFWAEEAHDLESVLPDLFGEPPKDDTDRGTDALNVLYQAVQSGKFTKGEANTRLHVLGLAPNAARIAIRFWETAPAHELARRIARHFDDIEIARAPHDPEHLSLSALLKASSRRKSDGSYDIPPSLGGEVMRAILEGLPYPAPLLNLAVQRCRAEQKPTYARAAAIKAALNRLIRRANLTASSPEKEFQTMLDPTSTNSAYRLGRLFATLEKVQEEASPGLNATIRDRYYSAASSTPVAVFTTLLRLKNHHLGKLSKGRAVQMERLIGEIIGELDDFPRILALPDQGRFALGYYHQRQAFFTKSDTPTTDNKEEPK